MDGRAGRALSSGFARIIGDEPVVSLAVAAKRNDPGPTNFHRAKLASREARGEPMPMTFDSPRVNERQRWFGELFPRPSCSVTFPPSEPFLPQQGMPDPAFAVDELVAEASPVAEEVAVDLAVVAVPDPSQGAVPFAGDGVAAHAAVDADRGRRLQVPLPRIVFLEGLVGEDARGADLHQVAAEFTLQGAVLHGGRNRRSYERQRH